MCQINYSPFYLKKSSLITSRLSYIWNLLKSTSYFFLHQHKHSSNWNLVVWPWFLVCIPKGREVVGWEIHTRRLDQLHPFTEGSLVTEAF